MKTFIFALLVILSTTFVITRVQAGNFGLPAQDTHFPEFEQHGNLFDLKIIPAQDETRLYLVGKEAASVKFENLSIVGKIKVGDTDKIIEFHKDKNYFSTKEVIHGHKVQIKAKDESNQKSEDFQIDLQKKP